MGPVADKPDLPALDLRQIAHRRIDLDVRKRQRFTFELGVDLVKMVGIDVSVTEGMNELSGDQARDLGHKNGKQGIAGDVERNAQEEVGRGAGRAGTRAFPRSG